MPHRRLVVHNVEGIDLKPILLRRSLYLLIPMDIAKVLSLSRDTHFTLTVKQNEECFLKYTRIKDRNGRDQSDEEKPVKRTS